MHVAFLTDANSRCVVGWRATPTLRTVLAPDELDQALYDYILDGPLVHHCDCRSQHLAIRFTDGMLEAGVEFSVVSRDYAEDNALAETINGLHKTEVIDNLGIWKGLDNTAYATQEFVA